MAEYVAYYRVSTDKQGIKGLGMDAQREAVARLMAGKRELAAHFIEVETGKKANGPQLAAAIAAGGVLGGGLPTGPLDDSSGLPSERCHASAHLPGPVTGTAEWFDRFYGHGSFARHQLGTLYR